MNRNVIIGAAAVVVGGALGVGVAGLPDHVSSDITIESVPSSVDGDGAPAATGLTTVAPTTTLPGDAPAPTTSLTITTGAVSGAGAGSAATTPG